MHYFLSAPFGYKLTGIEHAILKRVALYDRNNLNCQIVTLNFSTELTLVLAKHQINPKRFINFFQFYQDFKKDQPFTQNQLLATIANASVTPTATPSDYRVYANGQYIMYVHCFPNSDRIAYINYFDHNGRKIKRELYDYLGYKSVTRILDDQQTIISEHYFNQYGAIFLERYTHAQSTQFIFQDKGLTLFFNHIDELHNFWLQKLHQMHPITYFYLDKNRLYSHLVGPINAPNVYKIAIFHSTHVRNPNQNSDTNINANYRYTLSYPKQFDAFVVATHEQKQDMLAMFGENTPIHVIPPSYVQTHRIHPNKRSTIQNKFKILSTGRYSVEKRLDHMIKAIKILENDIPQMRLDLYGFGNQVAKNLNSLITSLNLTEKVTLKGYSANIKEALYQADLSLVTSKIEGFCMAIMDSLEQGTPVIAYDIKYGPASIINHGHNGSLVEEGNIEALAQAIKAYYQIHRATYTRQTERVACRFSADSAAKKWQLMIHSFA